MSRPIHAIIHQDALRHNLNIARQYAPQSEVFAVVKANAYGHGIERVFEAFQTADGFALLDLAEAQRLRALGWQGKILLLEGIFSLDDLQVCAELNLSFTIHSHYQVEWLTSFAQQHDMLFQFDVFLKMNSGMNRLGFTSAEYREVWQTLKALPCIAKLTHMTHFSDADGDRLGQCGVGYQMTLFQNTIQDLAGACSVSNSAAILRHAQHLHSDVVRSGIMLYGSSPDYPRHSILDWDLQPSMSLRSQIIAIQTIQAHETVGYGSHFTADKEMRIGIVACGYADGYQRMTQTGTPVLVDSDRTHIVGRISMDMIAVDLTDLPQADIGSEVVLWGKSSKGVVLSIDEVAAGSNTVGYELMCGVTSRVNFHIEKLSP